MQISDNGVALIKSFEGFSPVPYKDVGGLNTVGYGHRIQLGEMCDSVTEAEADTLLRKDLQTAEDAVNQLVTAPLNQNQFDALCSWTFNLGRQRLEDSTLLQLLNQPDYQGASAQITRWKYINHIVSDGLSRRREAERALFDKPV
jgi:lysozyme